MKRFIIATILVVNSILATLAQVGTWRNYLSYYEPQQAEDAGDYLFVLASNALYQYNRNDQSITTYDKTNGMSDVGITHIAWNNSVKRLIAVYENSNIDVVSTNGDVENLPDFYSKSMTEEKTVNSVYVNGKYAYLSTDFGIVKVNMQNVEISETYNLGFKVNYSYIEGSTIYAASQSKGIYSAPLSANLLDKANWQYSKAYVAKSNTIDDETLALINTLSPGGPKYNYCGFLLLHKGKLYTCNGIMNIEDGSIQCLSDNEWTIFEDEIIPTKTGRKYQDVTSVAIDPNDESHLFAGARNGLYEFRSGKFLNFYNDENSLIESFNIKDKEYQLVTGLVYDDDNNLWMLNSQAPKKSIIKLDANGNWSSADCPALMKLNDGEFTNKSLANMHDFKKDMNGNLWFVNDYYIDPSFYQFNPSTEQLISYTNFTNQDGTNAGNKNVKCIAEDKDGNMWVGTDAGPFYLDASSVGIENSTLIQPKVARNDGTNLADYLLSSTTVLDIEIDAANRKWIATSGNGVYLISDDYQKQLQHFTSENSSLLSDVVYSIQINNATGEVFFGTEKGLCSYVSNATEANDDMTSDNVYAYPNPVTPDYQGEITIVGLSYNADVKITSSNGAVVYSGRSQGGSFSWDGCDKDGKRVAGGVYLVLSAKQDGTKGTVCKIAILR